MRSPSILVDEAGYHNDSFKHIQRLEGREGIELGSL